MGSNKTFRFDDVCINANSMLIRNITNHLIELFPDCKIIYGVSPLVHNNCKERVYPKIFNAYSDYRKFFEVDRAGVPNIPVPENVVFAGHGIVHVDHRLLNKQAQEMSILISCSLVKAKVFIPPFNKWNEDTAAVCKENGIELVKFEAGWKSMEFNEYNPDQELWYLHAREWTLEEIKNWFK